MHKFLIFISLALLSFPHESYSKSNFLSRQVYKILPSLHNTSEKKRFKENPSKTSTLSLYMKKKAFLKRVLAHNKIKNKKTTSLISRKTSKIKTRKIAKKISYQPKKNIKQKPKRVYAKKTLPQKKNIKKTKSQKPLSINPYSAAPHTLFLQPKTPLPLTKSNVSQDQLDKSFPLKSTHPLWQVPQWQVRPFSDHQKYFSSLNKETQKNVKIGGLDHLFLRNFFGQNQTIAAVEERGTWSKLTKNIHLLSVPYQNIIRHRFLPPINEQHPDLKNISGGDYEISSNHGSEVASVLLDLAPQANIIPISVYNSSLSKHIRTSYDIADAIMDLSTQPHVNVINLSTLLFQTIENSCLFPSKYIQALQMAAKAEKAIVIAAGNTGTDFQTIHPTHNEGIYLKKFFLHLFEKLDSETRKSIIFAGNLNPLDSKLDQKSTRPGSMLIAQESFLCAPGLVRLSYEKEKQVHTSNSYRVQYQLYSGTSYAAPYISAAIADILSTSRSLTPKQVVQALLETADKADKKVYGRGIIRTDKALEYLEKNQ